MVTRIESTATNITGMGTWWTHGRIHAAGAVDGGTTCTKAAITSPAPNTTLPATQTFTWSNTGCPGYWLYIGTAQGTYNIFSG